MACHIPLYLSPDTPLGIGQGIGKVFYDILCLPDRLYVKMADCVLGLLFHHAHSQYKKQKFIKNKSSPAKKHILFISGKMNFRYCKIILCQMIVAAEILRQIFLHNLLLLQCLMHGLDYQLVGQSLCQAVYGVQGVQHFPVLFGGEHFRVLHGKAALLLCDHSTKYVAASRGYGVS